MPRYQATRRFLLNGTQFENQITKSRSMKIGDIVDYDPNLHEFVLEGIIAKGDLSALITKGFLVQTGSSPIFETSNIGTIHASDILFTPTGGIQSTNLQDAIVETYAESGHTQFTQESIPVTSAGQTMFLLSNTPFSSQSVSLFIDSAVYINGIDFTVSGDVITWLNRGFTLNTTDVLSVAYFIAIL